MKYCCPIEDWALGWSRMTLLVEPVGATQLRRHCRFPTIPMRLVRYYLLVVSLTLKAAFRNLFYFDQNRWNIRESRNMRTFIPFHNCIFIGIINPLQPLVQRFALLIDRLGRKIDLGRSGHLQKLMARTASDCYAILILVHTRGIKVHFRTWFTDESFPYNWIRGTGWASDSMVYVLQAHFALTTTQENSRITAAIDRSVGPHGVGFEIPTHPLGYLVGCQEPNTWYSSCISRCDIIYT